MNLLEQGVWEKVQDGDLKSFRLLFDTFYKGLYNYAFDFVKSREEAEELVLDIFQTMWSERASITINSSVKSYLYRSVHNRCINFIRQLKSTRRKVDEYNRIFLSDESTMQFMTEEFPLNRLIVIELEQDIESAMAELPDQCRKVFQLSRFEQMKTKDIAKKLNISESTVKTHIARALDKVRSNLGMYLS